MKRTLSGVVWMGMWGIMVIEQMPAGIVEAGKRREPEAGAQAGNRSAPRREPRVYRLEEMKGGEGIQLRSQLLFGRGFVSQAQKAEASEDEALIEALKGYGKERETSLEKFLEEYPQSRWSSSVKYRLGVEYRQKGYLSKALGILEEGWRESQGSKEGSAERKQAEEILGELVDLNARFGRKERLKEILSETENWKLEGKTREAISGGKQGLWGMENRPGEAFKCGPLALYCLKKISKLQGIDYQTIEKEASTDQGICLSRVQALAGKLKMDYQMAHREAGAAMIVPAVVHWKEDHYAAVVGKSGKGMYQVEDPTFGGGWYASQDVFDQEGSGYYLVPEGKLPEGWRTVSKKEGQTVWGKGMDTAYDYCKDNPEAEGCGGGGGDPEPAPEGVSWVGGSQETKATGMPSYKFHAMLCGLSIRDVPVGYAVGRGPGVPFGLQYTQRAPKRIPRYENNNGTGIEASPLGAGWAYDWESFVHVQAWPPGVANNTIVPSQTVESFHGAEGIYREKRSVSGYGSFGNLNGKADKITGGAAYGGGANGYERIYRDGSKEVYGFKEGLITPCTQWVSEAGGQGGILLTGAIGTERFYLSKLVDSNGSEATFNYEHDVVQMDSEPEVNYPNNEDWVDGAIHVRLGSVVDSAGKVSEYHYWSDNQADGEAYYRVKEIVDPYGRTAKFAYNPEGKLKSITDAVGLESSFEWEGDFINKMVTPYGTTTFQYGEKYGALTGNGKPRMDRYVQATDAGGTQKLEHRDGMYLGVEGETKPQIAGESFDALSNRQTTYFWDRKAWAQYPGDYSKAKMIRWLKRTDAGAHVISEYKQSEKYPLQSRVWYKYPGQQYDNSADGILSGGPRLIAQVIDGVTHYVKKEYNELGNVTKITDAAGRIMTYEYAANKIDLLKVKAFDGFVFKEVKSLAYNDPVNPHQPTSITGADGQVTTIGYNAFGQMTSMAGPDQLSTSLSYDNATGYLLGIDPPGAENFNFSYDQGQIHTVSDQDGYTVTTDHDALDRITQISYPDGTSDQYIYDRLDPSWSKDRLGRWSWTYYASAGQPSMVKDSNGNVIQYEWCSCGGLAKMIDPQGHTTTWMRDLQGRVTAKVYPNGKTETLEYNEGGQIKKVKDSKGGEVQFTYNADGTTASIQLNNVTADVTQVNLGYDPHLVQLSSRTEIGANGSQVTTYGYKPLGQLGAGNIALIDGPGAADTITCDYDAMGRMINSSINGKASLVSYGNYSRVDTRTNPLGTFINTYDGATSRLLNVQYPNGIIKGLGYDSIAEGQRLKTLTYKDPNNSVLSSHQLQRDATGRINQWIQTTGAEVKSLLLEYDPIDQLTSAVKKDGNGQIEKEWSWGYDGIGNRVWEHEDSQVKGLSYNPVNQLQNIQGGSGKVRVKGATTESAKVEIAGKVLHTDSSHRFQTEIPVSSGVNTVAIKMSNNAGQKIRQIQVNVSGSGNEILTYDDNGNLLTDHNGSKTYEWDGANRLKKVTQGAQVSEFTYDGKGRLSTLTEKDNGIPTAAKEFLWMGNRLAREIDSVSGIEKRFYPQGFESEHNGTITKYYYGKDHLGSIREVLDDQGNVLTRYDYTPYGERTKVTGASSSPEAPFGFTGHYFHARTGLHLTRTRAYDARTGRWLSRDPIAEAGGLNLYAYVGNNPINATDPSGLYAEGMAIHEIATWVMAESQWGSIFNMSFGLGGSLFVAATASLAMGPGWGFQDPAKNMATWRGAESISISDMSDPPDNGDVCEEIAKEYEHIIGGIARMDAPFSRGLIIDKPGASISEKVSERMRWLRDDPIGQMFDKVLNGLLEDWKLNGCEEKYGDINDYPL